MNSKKKVDTKLNMLYDVCIVNNVEVNMVKKMFLFTYTKDGKTIPVKTYNRLLAEQMKDVISGKTCVDKRKGQYFRDQAFKVSEVVEVD